MLPCLTPMVFMAASWRDTSTCDMAGTCFAKKSRGDLSFIKLGGCAFIQHEGSTFIWKPWSDLLNCFA